MMPRISVVPKISIRKKPLAINGMIRRTTTTAHAAGFWNSVQTSAGRSAAVAGGLVCRRLPGTSWVSDMSAPRQQALWPYRQHEHHDQESDDDRVGRDVDGAELLGESDDQGAERSSRNRSHAANDDDDQGGEQEPRILTGRQRLECTANHARNAGKSGTQRKDRDEYDLNANAGGGEDVAVIDAGAHHHADARTIEREPHRHANHDRGGEDDQPHQRIEQVDGLARGFD